MVVAPAEARAASDNSFDDDVLFGEGPGCPGLRDAEQTYDNSDDALFGADPGGLGPPPSHLSDDLFSDGLLSADVVSLGLSESVSAPAQQIPRLGLRAVPRQFD